MKNILKQILPQPVKALIKKIWILPLKARRAEFHGLARG